MLEMRPGYFFYFCFLLFGSYSLKCAAFAMCRAFVSDLLTVFKVAFLAALFCFVCFTLVWLFAFLMCRCVAVVICAVFASCLLKVV